MNNQKFNIGDKVIDLSFLTYLDNQFWNKKYINDHLIKVVQVTKGNLFSFTDNEIPEFIAGSNEYKYYKQNGMCLSYHPDAKVYHVEKDAQEIDSIIAKAIKECEAKNKIEEERQIQSIQQQINSLNQKMGKLINQQTPPREALSWSMDQINKVMKK